MDSIQLSLQSTVIGNMLESLVATDGIVLGYKLSQNSPRTYAAYRQQQHYSTSKKVACMYHQYYKWVRPLVMLVLPSVKLWSHDRGYTP